MERYLNVLYNLVSLLGEWNTMIDAVDARGKKFSLRDFDNLDSSEDADFLIHSMESHYDLKSMREIKKTSLDMLQLENGDIVLELGCGLGIDTEAIRSKLDFGQVIGTDLSQKMINESKRRSRFQDIVYQKASAKKIEYPDNYFTKCKADRLLVSQTDVDGILSEIKRVLIPNGKICITDLDFDTMFFCPELTGISSAILKYWKQLVENPLIGRQLPMLFIKHGFEILRIESQVFFIRNYEMLKKIVKFEDMLQDAKQLQLITQQEISFLLDQISEIDRRNGFLWGITLHSVLGNNIKGDDINE